jgi:hypothetical protein
MKYFTASFWFFQNEQFSSRFVGSRWIVSTNRRAANFY